MTVSGEGTAYNQWRNGLYQVFEYDWDEGQCFGKKGKKEEQKKERGRGRESYFICFQW